MKYLALLLLSVCLAIKLKAQESPHDEYTTFAKFQNYDSYVDYIADHVKKPDAISGDNKGVLKITVLIDSTGKASVYKIAQKISPEVDAEFIKAIITAPQWTPANLNGKLVPVYFTMQIGVETNKAASTMISDASVGKIYNAVDISPKFPGGESNFRAFINSTLKYPETAKQNHIQGRVFLQFIVERDGSLSEIKVLSEPGGGLGAEAQRVMRLSPKWTPGIHNGKEVRVQYTMPINFNF